MNISVQQIGALLEAMRRRPATRSQRSPGFARIISASRS
jgi:hypothetical protein